MTEPHPIADRNPKEMRARLEEIGPARVRFLLSSGMLVQHLIVPALEWTAELDAKDKGDAVAQGEGPNRP